MPEDDLAKSKKQTLRGVIHGTVSGLLIDVESFKVNPHRMRGIGDSTMSEGVSHEQIAEFVVDGWLRNWFNGQHCDSSGEGEKKNGQDRSLAVRRELRDAALNPREPAV